MPEKIQKLFTRRNLECLTIGILSFCVLLFLVVVPLGTVLSNSFIDNNTGAFTVSNWADVFTKDNLTAIGNSLLLSLCVTLFSSVLALPTAYFLSRTKLKNLWWLDIILMIPFMIPPYINSMGWMLFMQRKGVLYRLWIGFKPLCSAFYSFPGMVWIMSMHTYPFLMTMMKNAFASFPGNIDDATRVYSKNKIRNFFHVYAPVLLPNYLIGAFLVFVKAISEYGTPTTFGVKINFTVFTTLITDYMQVSPINFSMAAAMASVLVTICMLLWVVEVFVTDKMSYSLPSGSQNFQPKGKTSTILGSIFIILLFSLSAVIPISTIVITSFKNTITKFIWAEGNFTWENYRIAFSGSEGFSSGGEALVNTFYISALSAFIILIAGIILGVYCRRYRNKALGKGVEFLTTLPQMIPNIVTGIGLIMFYNAIYKFLPVYRTKAMLVLGYLIVLLPTMFSYIKNSLTQMPESILEAGDIFAKNRLSVDLHVVIPIAAKGAFYGFVMTLIVAFRELVMAKLLQPAQFYTVSLYIDSQFEQGNQQAAMALAVVSVIITLAVLLPLEFISARNKRRKKIK